MVTSNILVRSMGPFSEQYMVLLNTCYSSNKYMQSDKLRMCQRESLFMLGATKNVGFFNGLLFPPVVAGSPLEFQRADRNSKLEHQDARRNMETGYVLLQRQKILYPHYYSAEQVIENKKGRQYPLFRQVINRHEYSISYFISLTKSSFFILIFLSRFVAFPSGFS